MKGRAATLSRPVRQRHSTTDSQRQSWRSTFSMGTPSPRGCRPPRAQEHALEAIRTLLLRAPPPTDAPRPEAALDELLGPLCSSGAESIAPAVSERGLVSLPSVGGGSQLADYLEESDRRLPVSFKEHLLLEENVLAEKRGRGRRHMR